MTKFFYFTIIIILNFGCSQKIVSDYRVKGNDQILERINISELKKTKSKETNREKIFVEKHLDTEKDLLYRIVYIVTNKKSNRKTYIQWNLDSDYIRKETYQFGYPFKDYFFYFKNGNLKSKSTQYVGKWRKDGKSTYTSFNDNNAVGQFYEYNIKGQIINLIDYDKIFKFSVYDVINLMKEKYSKDEFEYSVTQKKYYQTANYYWEVIYETDNYYPKLLQIDGKTGNVTEKGDYIVKEM